MREAPEVNLVPIRKIGTPFQSPSWRAEALFHPIRFGLGDLCSDTSRRRNSDVTVSPIPEELEDVLNGLSPEHKRIYLSLIKREVNLKKYKKQTWNISAVNKHINDEVFRDVVLHVEGIKTNTDAAYAINLGTDERQGVVAKMLSYSIFLGKSDTQLYKDWDISPNKIKWYRLLFADFSHFPKDNVAKWSVLRQLTNNNVISEIDFNYFRRISELGDVALKAQCAFHTLTDDERSTIEAFLGNTAIVNVLDQHTAIRTIDDSRQYTRSVMEFAKLAVQKQHMRNVEISIRMNSAKLEQISAADSGMISPEEQKLLDELYKRSLVNAAPLPVKTIADLK